MYVCTDRISIKKKGGIHGKEDNRHFYLFTSVVKMSTYRLYHFVIKLFKKRIIG